MMVISNILSIFAENIRYILGKRGFLWVVEMKKIKRK